MPKITIDQRIALAKKQAEELDSKYGIKTGSTGYVNHKLNVVSTGSLLWDYQSGVGGHLAGTSNEVFGVPSIGKTTIAGASALKSAQEQGMLTGVIATEPDVEEKWLAKNGVNLDYNVLARPDTGEEAFEILWDWVNGGVVDWILFDSLGGLSSAKEQDSDKPQAYGNAALIAWGVKRVITKAWKNNVGIMYINQVRDKNINMGGKSVIVLTSPGGWTLEHMMSTRTMLKPGSSQYKISVPNGGKIADKVLVGREIIATFPKNKKAEAMGKAARFDYFHIETDDFPFGFDIAKDVMAAARVSGVFEITGGWIKHSILPGGKVNGKDALDNWIGENPDKVAEVRQEVISKMDNKVTEYEKKQRELKVVS